MGNTFPDVMGEGVMPWKETGPMFERHRFISDYLSKCFSMSELARRYGVSRKTLYKWLARFRKSGAEGLSDHSRRPMNSPSRTSAAVENAIVAYRRRKPDRGPKKIVARLAERKPEVDWPAPSTAGDILRRRGLVASGSHRRSGLHPLPSAPERATESGDLDTTDFKGQFRMGNGQYCYPLTIVESFSRYILACDALPSTEYEPVRKVFERVFRTYGLPRRIRSDNGSPFASTGLGRLSRLALWWIRLGITVERIMPGRPDQNGAHERMHRELKRETTRPAAMDLRAQQLLFNRFIDDYNNERPHEALGQKRPATQFVSSPRPYPSKLPPLVYPAHYETRKADHKGMISWRCRKLFLSSALAGEPLGLTEIDDGIWSIFYAHALIGRFDERNWKVYG
jgi:putative transposase